MIKKEIEAALEATRENLEAWHADMTRLSELSTLQMHALVPSHTEGSHSPFQDITTLREAAKRLTARETDSPLLQAQQLFERVALCRALPQSTLTLLFDATGINGTVGSQTPPAPRVAILGSPLFHTAKEAFTPVLPAGDPLLCGGFADICERVAAGDAAFGILPLEDSVEGKLFRIYEELEQFDLHIAYTMDLVGDGKTVRMALLYKNYPPIAEIEGTRILECVLYEEGDASLCQFLTVANALGLTLRRIDSLSVSYREDGFAKHAILQTNDEGALLLAAYIALFMPRTVIVADYIHIDKELS